jgi:uncharacterized protein YeaO (DUF488 family)
MIKTKSTEDPISSRDGLRLFVTRYWPRGHSREDCDEWIPSLAPSESLLKQIQTDRIAWKAFEQAYKSEMLQGYCDESERNVRMRNSGQRYFIRLLKRIAADRTITLICICPSDAVHCHRHILQRLLAE